jgi:flagellin-like hook-associated protein FlgL
MGRIGAALSGIERTLLNRLAESNAAATVNLLRLTTGVKINAPRDNPSGFSLLSRYTTQLGTLNAALTNVTAAAKQIGDAQDALTSIREQLDTVRAKVLEDENQELSADQRAANQSEIDAALKQIDQLATATFGHRRLLDGSANYAISGVNATQVSGVEIYARGPSTAPTISGSVLVAAEQATLTHATGAGTIAADATFTLTGDRGTAVLSVTDGESLTTVRDRINDESHHTGVEASVSGNDLIFNSIAFGSDAFVAINVDSGALATSGDGWGTDAEATIQGQSLTGDGNVFYANDQGLRFRIEFASGFSGSFDTVTVSGDALSYAVSEDLLQRVTVAIPGVQSARLGGLSGRLDQLRTGGTAAGLGANAVLAVRIVDEALGDLERVGGILEGASTSALHTSSVLLQALQQNVADAANGLNLVNNAEENLLLEKNQSLGVNALAALNVLNQQRDSILALIKQIAGL